jgi:hypothetical protein
LLESLTHGRTLLRRHVLETLLRGLHLLLLFGRHILHHLLYLFLRHVPHPSKALRGIGIRGPPAPALSPGTSFSI